MPNKDISDRITEKTLMLFSQFLRSPGQMTELLAALVTVSQQIKADCIHCSQFLVQETVFFPFKCNDETSDKKKKKETAVVLSI